MRILISGLIVCLIYSGPLYAQGGGSALYFDGSNDMVICGTDSSLDIQEKLTIEAWINGSPSQSTYARIVDKYRFHSQQGYNLVRNPGPNSSMIDLWATDGSKHTHGGTTPTFNEKWHYVAATFNGDTICFFIDGKLETRSVLTDTKTIRICADYLAIGNGYDGAVWFPYRGIIDEVRLWNTAVDSATIVDWMHKKTSIQHPDFNHLVGHWTFDEGAGSFTSDLSGTGNHGVLTNMDTTVCWVKSTIPVANSFANQLQNVAAVWHGLDSARSSIFSVAHVNIVNEACVIFGHDGAATSWVSNDIPGNSDVLYRIGRIWRTEVYDTVSGDLIFDVSGLGITERNLLKLLKDSDGIFSNADTINGTYDPINDLFVIHDQEFQHGNYYTLGTEENIAAVESARLNMIPAKYRLLQNYPNPFNPYTCIEFTLPKSEYVQLKIFNILGKEVSMIVSTKLNQGNHTYTFDGRNLASGIYYYQLTAGTYREVKKMIVIR